MRALLFLLAAVGLSFSASCMVDATATIMSEQGGLIMVVMMLMAVIIAIAYALGTAINNPNMVIFAKDEIHHLAFSALLLAGFSAVVIFSCDLTGFFFHETFGRLGTSMCYAEGEPVSDVAMCYVQAARSDARSMSERYVQNYIDELMSSTWSFSITIPLFNSITSTADAYHRVIANQYNIIFSTFLVPALMSISMQRFALTFITENMIRWVLPTAFVLRFFAPTRHMGNIFIALALALYVLVPLMYAFNMAMYDVVFDDCTEFASAACDNAIDGGCGSPAATCSNPDSLWNVARLIPQAFFLPNLTIALVITFLSSINKALRVIG